MLTTLQTALQAATVEREDEILALMLGAVAREHVLQVGPPGTAKSYVCRMFAKGIDGARYCERLLSPTTPPEAVWGPVSLSALREDRYVHATAGYAADAHVLYLDEVGRASPAISDSLLHLLGPERQALIGTEQVTAPLVFAVGSANTWPEDAAMLDRWLIRKVVRPVSPAGRDRLLWESFPPVSPCLSLTDLQAAHATSQALPVSEQAKEGLSEILDALHGHGIAPSDRRSRAAVKIARACAAIHGATEVQRQHLEPLGMVLWDQPEHAETAAETVGKIANPSGSKLMEMLREAEEIVTGATDAAARMAAVQRLLDIERQIRTDQLLASNARTAKVLEYVRRSRVRIQAQALGISAEKAEALL